MINALSKGVISEKAFIGLYFVNHRGEFKEIKDFEVRNDRLCERFRVVENV